MFVIEDYDTIKVSTRTFIILTSVILDLRKMFEILPVTPYVLEKKTRPYIINVEDGSLITIKFEDNVKGKEIKIKKPKPEAKLKWFRNSITLVVIIDKKPINFKICSNGVFQMTGATLEHYPEMCIQFLWKYIKDYNIHTFKENSSYFKALIIPAMRNIDFKLGFTVDREKLAEYLSIKTEFHCLHEASLGYTGVNVKINLDKPIVDMPIVKLEFIENDCVRSITTYNEYLSLLPEKERIKKLNKKRYNTFLIFHSGNCIFSTINDDYGRNVYYRFLNVLADCVEIIREKIE